jgi:hypothetical protein
LKFTIDVDTNPVPLTVRVNAPELTITPVGTSAEMTGAGLFTVKVDAPEVPPAGAGLKTVTERLPAVAISVARIAAVMEVALTNVVALATPLKLTTDEETKPVPVIVNVKAAPPAMAVVGAIEVIAGTGFGAALMLKFMAAEVPPPGVGFVTVTGGVPAEATSPARIAAVICVELTNVVTLAVPLKFTTELATKPVPFTVRVKAPVPATTPVGDSEVMVGAGLFTAKFMVFEAPPPGVGLVTTTGKLPAVVTSPARMAAVTTVELTNVVVRAFPLKVTAAPLTKPVPLTVKVKAPEFTSALAGDNDVIAGVGLFMAKGLEFEVPPPGVGLTTVI